MSEFDKLIETLTDESSSSFAKRTAIEGLGTLGDERAVPHLGSALKDNNRYVRRETVRALGQVGSSQAVEPLLSVLDEEDDEYVLREAIVALGHIGDERAVKALTKILDSHWFLNRRAAQEALAQIEAHRRDAQQEVEQAASLLETPKSPQTPVELEADEAEPIPDEERPSVSEAPAETLEKKAQEQEQSIVASSEQEKEKRLTDEEREQLQKAIEDYQREKQEKIDSLDVTELEALSRARSQGRDVEVPSTTVRAPEPTSQAARVIIPQQPPELRDQRSVSGKAIATFLCGMLCLLFRQPFFFILGLVAILVGVAEIRAIRREQTEQTGNTNLIMRNAVVILGMLCATIGMFITLMAPTLSH